MNVKLLLLPLMFLNFLITVPGQNALVVSYSIPPVLDNYQDCAAILHNDQLLVNHYTPEGTCKVSTRAKGLISVAAVKLFPDGAEPQERIEFQVAIKNNRTNTLVMYAAKTFREVRIEDILRKCERGDEIVILTVDPNYSLTHHQIEVLWGC